MHQALNCAASHPRASPCRYVRVCACVCGHVCEPPAEPEPPNAALPAEFAPVALWKCVPFRSCQVFIKAEKMCRNLH